MNNAGRGLRGDGVMWYSTDGDRLIHDRRRQTNFTLLGEPLQSWHHNVPCFCQRKERDKWQRGAAPLFGVSNICRDVCFSQGFSCCGLAIFNTQRSYRADRTSRPCLCGQSCASVSQQIKKETRSTLTFTVSCCWTASTHRYKRGHGHLEAKKNNWSYLYFLIN